MRSSEVMRRDKLMTCPLFTRLRCVSITPLGRPVVPEVYWILATSSGRLAWGGTSTPRASMSCQEAPSMKTTCSSASALPLRDSSRMAR